MILKISFILIIFYLKTLLCTSPLCPCEDLTLCEPIEYHGQEVFAFVVETHRSVWSMFDWTKLTTVALFNFYDPELMCFAHQNNVRVVSVGSFPKEDLKNDTKINQWIDDQIQYAKDRYLDGINIDVEYDIDSGSDLVRALSSFTARVRDRFHASLPKSQVTFDVPWSPYNEQGTGVDGRNYNFTELAKATDFLFIMAYDEQSQIFGPECTARPNSHLYDTVGGISAYQQLGIDANKLVLGLPWYGYDYRCIEVSQDQRCHIKKVAFRGVDCSDAAGTQLSYEDIRNVSNENPNSDFFDPNSQTQFLWFIDETNTRREIWYDNSNTLSYKISFAVFKNLRGVGIWNANMLDYSGSNSSKAMVADMWGTFPQYKKVGKYTSYYFKIHKKYF